MLLTIFTPTYNRAHTLKRLFNSIQLQQSEDFEWLIIDDGSTDNTDSIIKEIENKATFPILFIKQQNGGKHRAYNNALKYARGNFLFTVDSDDWLPENSLMSITSIIRSNPHIFSDEKVAGIIALKNYADGNIIGHRYINSDIVTSLSELSHSGQGGERSIILKTDIAKLYPYPAIATENFMTESVVYDQIDINHKFFVSNEELTSCEYQADGLSSNPKRLMVKNPGGYMIYYSQRIDIATSIKERIGYIIRYNAFKRIYSGKELYYTGRYRLLCLLLYPISYFVSKHYLRYS